MPRTALASALRKLFFFDHGTSLLRPGAANWLVSMWILALAMALLEGFTWAKILLLLLPPEHTQVAMAVGVAWGIGIWLVDASFATQDTARDYAAGPAPAARQGWRGWLANRLLMGSLIRICVISFSMTVTGPFLARTLDERNVLQAMQAANTQALAGARQRLSAEGESALRRSEAEVDVLRTKLERETAGKGASGRIGDGPAARAIRENIAAKEAALARQRTAHAALLRSFDATPPDELARRHGVRLLADSADTRARLRREQAGGEELQLLGFPASHVVASSLFLLLFLVMLVLKIYQPRSVAIYLNDHLQEAYGHYRLGGFAGLPATILEPCDRHDGGTPMGARRFDLWYHGSYLPAEQSLQALRAKEADRQARVQELQRLEDGCRLSEQTVQRASTELLAALEEKARLTDALAQHRSDRQQQEQQMTQTEAQISHTYLGNLAAQRTRVGAEQQQSVARLAAVERQLEQQLPAQLDEVVRTIQQMLRRHGVLADAPPADLLQSDPLLAAHMERRTRLLAERQQAADERVALGLRIRALEAEMQSLGARIDAGIDIGEGPIGANDRALEPLWERRAAARRVIDDLDAKVVRRGQRLHHVQQQIAALEERLRQEAAALDTLQSAAREKRVALSTLPTDAPA